MTTLLIISFLLLAVTAIALRFSVNRRLTPEISRPLPTSQFDGLFGERHAKEVTTLAEEDAKLKEQEVRRQQLARATKGEIGVMDEAHATGDVQFYREVLQAVFTQADDNPKILHLIAKHIVESGELRSSSEFSTLMVERWRQLPSQYSLATTLHLAALADDVEVFELTINAASALWSEGRIKISVTELLAIFESAYWLISDEVRISGAGFLLKQAIADVRRELAAANRQSA